MANRVNILVFSLLLPMTAVAGNPDAADALFQPQFMFKHQTISAGNPYADEKFWRDENVSRQNVLIDKNNPSVGKMNQFDATISYPFTRRDAVNLDLGVNIRVIDGDFSSQSQTEGSHHFYTAFPMLYANALFNLPYDGLQASIGASHLEYDQYYALDYKAKLSYTWSSGFGLEGGWQHQQFSIDNNDIQAQFENKGPFLDFKYRF